MNIERPLFRLYKSRATKIKSAWLDNEQEWEEYLKETGKKMTFQDITERFNSGVPVPDVYAQSIEYCKRSLIPRDWQYYLAREINMLLQKEERLDVLDFGCGAGNVGLMLASMGYRVKFLDVKGEITDFVEWRLKRRFLPSKVYTHNQEPQGVFDMVLMINVLEHLQKPVDTVRMLTNKLKPGGYFLLHFRTDEHDLDLLTWDTYREEIEPYIKEHFNSMGNKNNLWQKKD